VERHAPTCLAHHLRGSLKLNVLKGSIDELMEHHMGTLFMPHGLGHFMGLETHDVGGYGEGHPPRIMEPGIKNLRTCREMKERMVVTVEPGCYFNWPILDRVLADSSNPQSKFLNREVIDSYRGFGGVRIEDDVIVWKDGIENMTKCPRTPDEIEKYIAENKEH